MLPAKSGELTEATGSAGKVRPPRPRARRATEIIPVVVLVALCAFFSLLEPRFFSFGNAMIVLQQSVSLLAAALAMTFVIVGGSIDLSVGSILALSALVSAASARHIGVYAFLPAVVVGTLAGFFNGIVFAFGRVPSFIATLGTMITFRGIVLYFTKGAPISIENDDFLDVFSGRTLGVPHSVVLVLLLVVISWFIYNGTVFGREVRAVGGGERVARLSGIRAQSLFARKSGSAAPIRRIFHQHGIAARQRAGRSGQYGRLITFHVDLDQSDAPFGKGQFGERAVEIDHRHLPRAEPMIHRERMPARI
ncbi:MAG TPA: ABC transporter permease [Anaeromyxobacteraceae bacterium]|nr:ABC transporter permease [Anaeromyxobacteraceae bacterium]